MYHAVDHGDVSVSEGIRIPLLFGHPTPYPLSGILQYPLRLGPCEVLSVAGGTEHSGTFAFIVGI